MSEKKLPNGLTLVFAPGCFDNFQGTQEELDDLVREIEEKMADASFLDAAMPLQDEALSEIDADTLLDQIQYSNKINTRQ